MFFGPWTFFSSFLSLRHLFSSSCSFIQGRKSEPWPILPSGRATVHCWCYWARARSSLSFVSLWRSRCLGEAKRFTHHVGLSFGDEVFGYMNTAVCSRQGAQRCIRLCCYQIGRDHNNGACLYWHRVGVLLFAPAIPLSGCLSLDFWLLLHTGQSQTALCPSNPPTPK